MNKFRILNEFGKVPTKSYTAAGWDFYVPDIPSDIDETMIKEALTKSYGINEKKLDTFDSSLKSALKAWNEEDIYNKERWNLLHLLLAIDGSLMRTSQNKVLTFLTYYLIEPTEDGRIGINLHCNDHILINSGIRVALDPGTAGIFFNKSGRGNKGFDTRACVVDEDYTGFVHLSLAYTKDNAKDGVVRAGDKLSQMLIIDLHKNEPTVDCLSKKDYYALMKNSERGDSGFGSTDKK